MGKKDTRFQLTYQKLIVGWHLLNYEEILVEIKIYIRYVVLTIIIFISMLDIELFYLK